MDRELSKKTFIWSQVVILFLGLLFLGGLYYYLNADFKKTDLAKYIPVTREPISLKLQILNPDDEIVVFDKTMTISGQTTPGSTVLISTQSSDSVQRSSPKGDFSRTLTLSPGLNSLTITVFDDKGQSKSEKRTIFYSEEKL